MSKYFYKDLGIKEDLKRHRDKEQELRDKIDNCRYTGNDIALKAYQNCLNILLSSKAKLVDKIGRQ